MGVYRVAPSRNLAEAARRTLEAWMTTWGVAGVLSISLLTTHLHIWWLLGVATTLLLAIRLVLSFTPWGRAAGRARTVLIGTCSSSRSLTTSQPVMDMEIVGSVPFTGEDPTAVPQLQPLGPIEELPRILREQEVDLALMSPSDAALTGEVREAFRACSDLGLPVQYFPSFLDVDQLHVNLTWSVDRPGLNVQTVSAPTFAHVAKRVIDVVGAGIGMVVLFPVFAACAIAVKLTSSGPIFFRQTRVGQGERTFSCLKFRTMRVGAHAQQDLLLSNSTQDGPAFKMPTDPRITPVGRILRKFSLDELPQLINVLFGDMSLVGPRPPIPSEVEKYQWWQKRRVSVKPGLTCLWQVYGRNRVSFKRWVEMDLYYIDNWSLWLDLKLIAHTFRAVLRGTGM
jgi:exopolysaccharide biosynthesis polyprenyl glycosylphosphotransferase